MEKIIPNDEHAKKNAFKLKNTSPGQDASDNEITPEETELLNQAGENAEGQELQQAQLDNTDEDGDPLNENASGDVASGSELDIPGSEDDDEDETTGREDEENNAYSLGADKKD